MHPAQSASQPCPLPRINTRVVVTCAYYERITFTTLKLVVNRNLFRSIRGRQTSLSPRARPPLGPDHIARPRCTTGTYADRSSESDSAFEYLPESSAPIASFKVPPPAHMTPDRMPAYV